MTILGDYRAKFPQYNDLPDDQLASALHRKYVAESGNNLPFDAFATTIGYQPAQQPAGFDMAKAFDVEARQSGFDEGGFQKWYGEQATRTGISPNPDDPEHKYDYRAAYKAGAQPELAADGKYHWPSQFKADDHPNRFVEINGVRTDTKTGKPAPLAEVPALAPDQIAAGDPQDGGSPIADGWERIFKSLPTQAIEAAKHGAYGALRGVTEVNPPEAILPPKPQRYYPDPDLNRDDSGVTPGQDLPALMHRRQVERRQQAIDDFRQRMEETPIGGPIRKFAREGADKARLALADATPENLSFWQGVTVDTARSLGISIPALGIGLATRNPTPALAVMATGEFGSSYDEAIRAGISPDKAREYAAINGVIEVATEKLPLDTLLKRGTPFFQRLLRLYGQELIGENAATVLQDATEFAVKHPDATFNEWMNGYVKQRPEAAARTSASTVISTTIQGGAAHAAHRAVDAMRAPRGTKDVPQDESAPSGDQVVPPGTTEPPPGNAPTPPPSPPNPTPPPGPVPPPDRRTDPERRKRVADMTPEELQRELLTDGLTGIPNRRAFEEHEHAEPSPTHVSIDADSLKWVNDTMGHASGDTLIKTIATALSEETAKAYRVSGDEFAIRAGSPEEAAALMDRVNKRLAQAIVEYQEPDGTVKRLTGIGLSFGIGATFDEADKALRDHKAEREAKGERAGRGAPPPGATTIPPEGKPNTANPPTPEGPVDRKKALQARLKAAKFTPTTATITTSNGPTAVQGHFIGDLLVHKDEGGKKFVVTHRPSGLSIARNLGARDARLMAMRLSEAFDWSFSQDELKAEPAKYRQHMDAVRDLRADPYAPFAGEVDDTKDVASKRPGGVDALNDRKPVMGLPRGYEVGEINGEYRAVGPDNKPFGQRHPSRQAAEEYARQFFFAHVNPNIGKKGDGGDVPQKGDEASAGSAYTGFLDDNPAYSPAGVAKPSKVVRREAILIPFMKALGIPIYEGRIKAKGVLGYYRPFREMVRLKRKSDLEMAAHEIAHLLDDRMFNGFRKDKSRPNTRPWISGPGAQEFAAELKSVSYDASKVYEGFAEFVRLWMTQPEAAQRAAPKFTAWWESYIEGHKYGPAIKKAKADMLAWWAQDPKMRLQSKIGPQVKINEAIDSVWDVWRQDKVDKFHGIFAMERALADARSPIPLGPYETARLTAAVYSITNGAIEHGAPVVGPNNTIKFEGKGLRKVLDQVADDLDNWITYAVAKSANELKQQGRENLFTKAEIAAGLALETPQFRRVFEEYLAWNKAVVDFGVAKGIIDPQARERWRREWYIPFYRVGTEPATRAKKGGVEGNWSGIKALTGGTANLRDVLDNMVQNASMIIGNAIRNEARTKAVDFALKHRGGGRFVVEIAKDTTPVNIDKAQIRTLIFRLLGIDSRNIGSLPEGVQKLVEYLERRLMMEPEWMKFWLFGQAPRGDNVIAVMRGGRASFYEVGDPIFYRAIAAINPERKHPFRDFLNAARTFGQSTITLTFDFMTANLWRDTTHAFIFSRAGFKPFIDSARGFKSRLTNDSAYRDFVANGGGFSSIYLTERALRKHIERSLRRFYTKKGINWRNVLYMPAEFIYGLEALADAAESSTRIGEYRKAIAMGANPRHAAYLAREVSTDFSQRGDEFTPSGQILGWAYDSIVFLKAAVNSLDRVYRGISKDPNRGRIAALSGVVAGISVGLYLMNRKLPCYERLEDWDKDTHWHVFVPNGKADCSTWLHLRLPKIWEVGAMSSIAERSMGAYLDKVESGHVDGKKYGMQIAKIVGDNFRFDYIPYVVEPLYETYGLNRERFTNREIENTAMKGRMPFARYSPYTSRLFVHAGEQMRDLPLPLQELVSPARMESLFKGYFNTAGLYAMMLMDETVYRSETPERRLDQYPILRRFVQTGPKRERREVEFWDALNELGQVHNTVNFMARQERGDLMTELEARPDLPYFRGLEHVHQAVTKLNKEMEMVYTSPLSREKKREQLDALMRERNELIEAAMKDLEEGQQAERRRGVR